MNLNYAETAKRHVQWAARATALIMIPLAAAVNAQAGPTPTGPVLPATTAGCSMNDNGTISSCSSGALNLGAGTGVLQGVSLFTSGGYVTFQNGGTAILTLSSTGQLKGGSISSGQVIPLSYDFELSYQNGDSGLSVSSWDLDYQLLDGTTVIGDSGEIPGAPSDPSLTGGAVFDSTSSMTLTGGATVGDTLTEQVTLSVDWSPGDSDSLQINVPGAGSFDYRSTNATVSNVPEPGTMGFAGSAFALAAFVLRRRWKG